MKIIPITSIAEVEKLLKSSALPSSDLHNTHLELWGAYSNNILTATVGVEQFQKIALLRSLAVKEEARGNGMGKRLVQFVENLCRSRNITSLYLLTETADTFFNRIGYTQVPRENAPESVQQTEQFSHLCPKSSIVMVKMLVG